MRYLVVAVTLAAIGFGASRLNRHNRAKGEAACFPSTRLVVVATPDVAQEVFPDGAA